MLGTFGVRPKATMTARAAGIASVLRGRGWDARILTVPWDNPEDAGRSSWISGVPVTNTRVVRLALWPVPVMEMIREAHRFKPDLIHLFKPKGFGDLAARYLRRIGYPVIVDMDDWEGTGGWNEILPYSAIQRRVFDWQERTWPAMAAGVTVSSKTLQQRAIELGASPTRVMYLPNQLTAERLQQLVVPESDPSVPYSIPARPRHQNILLYTRFVEFEPEFVVDVLRRVRNRVPDAHLVVAGSSSNGNAERRLLMAAGRTGERDNVSVLGWIDPRDIGWIAARCAVGLVPFDDTLVNRAKCSVKLLELIACGLPVVASNIGENREFLMGERSRFLARPGSADDHADRIVEVLYLSSSPERAPYRTPTDILNIGLWEDVAEDVERFYRRSTE